MNEDPAAVIVGSVLEEHLRQLCLSARIPTEDVSSTRYVPHKADRLNSDLAKAGNTLKLDQKQITAWLDLRNKAAHGKYSDYSPEQVALMLAGVRDFVVGARLEDGDVHRPLEKIARVRCEVSHPSIELDDERIVIGLTELDEAEAFTTQNDLEVEVGRFRTPRLRRLGHGGPSAGRCSRQIGWVVKSGFHLIRSVMGYSLTTVYRTFELGSMLRASARCPSNSNQVLKTNSHETAHLAWLAAQHLGHPCK